MNPSTDVRLYFKAVGLADMDTLSKSDPYCVLYATTPPPPPSTTTVDYSNPPPLSSYTLVGGVAGHLCRTETVKDSLHPHWKMSAQVPFLFESKQSFRAYIFDDDGKGPTRGDDCLGQVDFLLSSVMCSRNYSKDFSITNVTASGPGVVREFSGRATDAAPRSTLTVAGVEMANTKDVVTIKFRGHNMKKMDMLGESDCYFILKRLLPGGQVKQLAKSEVVDDSADPTWRELRFAVADLTGSHLDEQGLEFSCFDEDVTSDEAMGRFRFSYNELLANFNSKTPFVLKDTNYDRGDSFGSIYVERLVIEHSPTFAEFLQAGMQINLAVSIDFTGSNGAPRDPRSLHYMDTVTYKPNQYLSAIMSIGDILIEYDSDKQVAVFGFGAAFNGAANHFFNLNMQPATPYVAGVQGVINAYGAFLPTCVLSGPTNFAPTINSVAAGARQQVQSGNPFMYTVLLIITDGAITDVNETISAIVRADDLPLSIVIVGVGNADFSTMDMLDSDGCALRDSSGRVARRDLVQFVPFMQFANQPREALAAAVLKEVPRQVEKYAQLNKLVPPKAAAPAAAAPAQQRI